jgi:uncharacterized protein (DUF305 family)
MNRRLTAVLLGAVLLAFAVAFSACGGDDESEDAANVDVAFAEEMIPHHESAIMMAEIASERAQHKEVKELAENIVATQGEEIATLEDIKARLGSDEGATLGLSEAEMGMDMHGSDLHSAEPFDREFIDMMVAHHQGAIQMARVEIAQGSDPEALDLAEAIVAAQSSEIEQMNEWRTEWYGGPSPAGGVPAETDDSMEMSDETMPGMDH